MLRLQIKKWFWEAVALDLKYPTDMKESLKLNGHKNLEGFFDRLTKEIEEAEVKCKAQGTPLKQSTVQEAVYSMTEVFLQGMMGERIGQFEADVQKVKRQHEADKIKEFDAVLAGKAEGEFAEAGVITNEKIDKQREVGFDVKEAHT